jgi:hypothetical protein
MPGSTSLFGAKYLLVGNMDGWKCLEGTDHMDWSMVLLLPSLLPRARLLPTGVAASKDIVGNELMVIAEVVVVVEARHMSVVVVVVVVVAPVVVNNGAVAAAVLSTVGNYNNRTDTARAVLVISVVGGVVAAAGVVVVVAVVVPRASVLGGKSCRFFLPLGGGGTGVADFWVVVCVCVAVAPPRYHRPQQLLLEWR